MTIWKEKGITAYVKYGYFDKEQRDRKYRENLLMWTICLQPGNDTYTCPIGQR